MLRDERVELMSFHELYGSSIFAAIFSSADGFRDLATSDPPGSTTPYALTASGRSLQLLGRAADGMTRMANLEFSPNPKIHGRVAYDSLLGLRGNAVRVESRCVSKMGCLRENHASWRRPPRLDYVPGPDSLREETATPSAKLILPPYSMLLLENAAR